MLGFSNILFFFKPVKCLDFNKLVREAARLAEELQLSLSLKSKPPVLSLVL